MFGVYCYARAQEKSKDQECERKVEQQIEGLSRNSLNTYFKQAIPCCPWTGRRRQGVFHLKQFLASGCIWRVRCVCFTSWYIHTLWWVCCHRNLFRTSAGFFCISSILQKLSFLGRQTLQINNRWLLVFINYRWKAIIAKHISFSLHPKMNDYQIQAI